MSRASGRCAAFLCAAGMLAAQQQDALVEPIAGPVSLPQRFRPGGFRFAARIVDAMTGRPIPGATLAMMEHSLLAGGSLREHRWQADADGFVRVRSDDAWNGSGFFLATADGHAPMGRTGSPPGDGGVIALVPGIGWPVEVRDVLDRPVAGVEVGLCLDDQTPDVRVATTDRDGAAVLPHVDPTGRPGAQSVLHLFVRGDGLAADPDEGDWQAGDPPTVLRRPPVSFVSGRIVSPNGRPLAGVLVSSRGVVREPWAITDGEGRFPPLSAANGLRLDCGARSFAVRCPAIARTLDLALPAGPVPAPPPQVRVTVVVRDAVDGHVLQDARVSVWHVGIESDGPGEDDRGATDAHGECSLAVVAGMVGVLVDPSPACPPDYETHRRDLVVRAGSQERVVVDLQPRAPMRLRVAADVERIELRTRDNCVDWIPAVDGETVMRVPAAAPFALRWFGPRTSERCATFATLPTDTVPLQPFPPTRVSLRVVDADGAGVAATVQLCDRDGRLAVEQHTGARGAIEFATHQVGCSYLRILPDDSRHRPRVLHVGLPRNGDDRSTALGDFVLPRRNTPLLRVLRADGSAGPDDAELLRPGLRAATGPLADDGGWDFLTPEPGDRVRVTFGEHPERDPAEPPGFATHRLVLSTTLAGPGPWTLREGTCRVRLEVVDDFGLWPERGMVVLADQAFGVEHVLELDGLPAGDHELFVGAESCDSARVRVKLRADERRTVEVVLRRTR